MTKLSTVLVKNGQVQRHHIDTGDSLREMQKAVGGLLTTVYCPDIEQFGVTLWANDEALLVSEPRPTLRLPDGQVLFGDLLFTGHDDLGNTTSLSSEQEKKVYDLLERCVRF